MKRLLAALRTIPPSVWICVGVYSLVFIGLSVFSYTHFFYTGLDLGIYDQTVWNTAHGRLFEYTFNPYSYLVDHREWWLLVIAPLYWVAATPVTLLVVQTLVIASGIIPLYLIARRVFADVSYGKHVALGAAIAYTMNPSIQHMNLFEFHALVFAVPLSLWLWWCIAAERWRAMWMCLALLLCVREDIGLMTAGVGFLLALRERSWRGRGAKMIVVSAVWFALMVIVGSRLAPDGIEKFLVFYDWLGSTPKEILFAVLQHPLRFMSVWLDYDHVVILVFLFMDVAFLAAFAPRYLLPTTFPLLLYLSLNQEMLAPVMKTHYSAVLIPWFLVAGVYGYRALVRRKWFRKIGLDGVAGLLICVVLFSQWLSNGPLWEFLHNIGMMQDRDLAAYNAVIDRVQPGDDVMVSARLYPHVAEREHFYTTMHTFTGKQHFADVDYAPPSHLDWILLEQEDVLDYAINLPEENRAQAHARLQTLIDENQLELVAYTEDLIVYGHPNVAGNSVVADPIVVSPTPLANVRDAVVDSQFQFSSWEYTPENDGAGMLRLAFAVLPLRSVYTDDYHFGLTWYDNADNIVKTKSFALGNGLEPTHTWEKGALSQRVIDLPITNPPTATRVELTVGRVRAQFGPLFTVWTPGPMFDPDHSQSFPLAGMLSNEESGK